MASVKVVKDGITYEYFEFTGDQIVNGASPDTIIASFNWKFGSKKRLYFVLVDGTITHHCQGTAEECEEMITRIHEDKMNYLKQLEIMEKEEAERLDSEEVALVEIDADSSEEIPQDDPSEDDAPEEIDE